MTCIRWYQSENDCVINETKSELTTYQKSNVPATIRHTISARMNRQEINSGVIQVHWMIGFI